MEKLKENIMAGLNIHLAIAKIYIEKNNISDTEDFYNGTMDPDLSNDKSISHYTNVKDKSELLSYLEGKVVLNDYLSDNDINNDYNKGIFLHLITDYLFFNDFFDVNYLKNTNYDMFVKDLYYSYSYINDYLHNKYLLGLSKYEEKINANIIKNIKEKKLEDLNGSNILSFDKLDFFIERVSDIDLDKYRKKILENGINVLPD